MHIHSFVLFTLLSSISATPYHPSTPPPRLPSESGGSLNVQNANHIFNAIHSSMRQWGSSLNHNGMSFFLATVPPETQLYHGTSMSTPVIGMQWLAFEPEHALIFARSRPEHGGPGRGGPLHNERLGCQEHETQYLEDCRDPGVTQPLIAHHSTHPPSIPGDNPRSRQHGPPPPHPYESEDDGRPPPPLHHPHEPPNERRLSPPPQQPFKIPFKMPLVQDPLIEPSNSSTGYLHTYAPHHPLHLLYIDGMSAGKTSNGTLDTQDRVLLNMTLHGNSSGHGGMFGEMERARGLCEMARTIWEDRIDGILRMEGGFEIILCDFQRHLRVVDIMSVASPPHNTKLNEGKKDDKHGKDRRPGPPPGGMLGGWQYYKAIAQRYHGIGGGRVEVNYEDFVTAFGYEGLDLWDNDVKSDVPMPRLTAVEDDVLAKIKEDITRMILRAGHGRSPSHRNGRHGKGRPHGMDENGHDKFLRPAGKDGMGGERGDPLARPKESMEHGDRRTPPSDSHRGPLPIGDHERPPPDSDHRGPPPKNDHRGPREGGHKRPPPNDNDRGPPPKGDHERPPPNDNHRPPPKGDHRRPPPNDNHRGPPPKGDHRRPPPNDNHRPPPKGDHRLPPPNDHHRGPPPKGDHERPPPNDNHRGSPPTGDHRRPPPKDHHGERPPPPPHHHHQGPSPHHVHKTTNWQEIVDMVITRYSSPLHHLHTDEAIRSSAASMSPYIATLLRPFIDNTSRNDTLETSRCVRQILPSTAVPAPYMPSLAQRSIHTVTDRICATLLSVLDSTTSSATSEKDHKPTDLALKQIDDLVAYLQWTTWKQCTGCSDEEVCVVPIWPMGTLEDHAKPSCKTEQDIHGGVPYWGEHRGPPPGGPYGGPPDEGERLGGPGPEKGGLRDGGRPCGGKRGGKGRFPWRMRVSGFLRWLGGKVRA